MVDDAPLELETEEEIRDRIRSDGRQARATEGGDAGSRPRLPLILAAVVLLLGTVEGGATLVQQMQAPDSADWEAAARRLSEQRKGGEPVLFAPQWVEPVGRLHVGDQLDMELQLLSDVDCHGRVFEVSIRGARHPWLLGEKPSKTWDLGAVTLAMFERSSPADLLFDFTRRIREARVSRIGQQVKRCPWDAALRRFVCDPARSWNWVGPHLAEVNHRPYRCVSAHAVDGHVMRITFPAAKVGSSMVGYTGIDDFENRKRSDEPVLLKVLVGPKEVLAIRHQSSWPWRRFSVDTKEMAGQTHPVSFEITAEKAFARTFCFSAETRK